MADEDREVLFDEDQEEEVFAFQDEHMRNEHAMLKRKQVAALGRETTAALELTASMSPEQTGAMNRFKASLMAEIEVNYAKYDEWVLHFAKEVEPYLPANPQMLMQPPHQQIRGHKEFNPSSETHPGFLQKDFTPTECSEWKRRFEAYLADGKMSGKELPMETVKMVFDRLMDNHWKHRIGHKIEGVSSKEEIYKLMDKELEITYPIMKRRTTFFSMTQKAGVSFSDFYREVEKQGAESRLIELSPEELVGHVTLTRMSDEVLQKELITKVKSTGKEALMEEALTQEAFRNLDVNNGRQQAKRVAPPRPSSHGSQRSSRDNSRERGKECFSCGKKGHLARDCKNPQKWCNNCKNYSHFTEDCRARNRKDDDVTLLEEVKVNQATGKSNNERNNRGRSKTPAARGRNKSPDRNRYRSPERGRNSGRPS